MTTPPCGLNQSAKASKLMSLPKAAHWSVERSHTWRCSGPLALGSSHCVSQCLTSFDARTSYVLCTNPRSSGSRNKSAAAGSYVRWRSSRSRREKKASPPR